MDPEYSEVSEYSIEKNTSFFGQNRRFSQYFELMVLHEFWSYADDQIVKIHLLDVKNPKTYIWSTSGQHVLPKFSLKETHTLDFAKNDIYSNISTVDERSCHRFSDLGSFKYGFWCKNHLCFMKNTSPNIWSTLRQHMLPKYTFKES